MSKFNVKNEIINPLTSCRNQPELFNKPFLKRPAYCSRQQRLCRSVVEYPTTVVYSMPGQGSSPPSGTDGFGLGPPFGPQGWNAGVRTSEILGKIVSIGTIGS